MVGGTWDVISCNQGTVDRGPVRGRRNQVFNIKPHGEVGTLKKGRKDVSLILCVILLLSIGGKWGLG